MIEEKEEVENNVENQDDSLKFKLENFEGPLDLLLHLVKEAKMDIEDIHLSEITGQYLQYMEHINEIDFEKSAGFIEIAAILIEIKSKHLLPRDEEEVLDEEDSEFLLNQRLKEYNLFKEAGKSLREIENFNKMYKEPDKTAGTYNVVIKQMTLDKLIKAFTNMLGRVQFNEAKMETKSIEKDKWTVEDKIFELHLLLENQDEFTFQSIIAKEYTKLEIITLFMAVLELLKRQEIKFTQDELYGEIHLKKNENEEEKLTVIE